MLTLLSSLLVTVLPVAPPAAPPVQPGAFSACPDPAPAVAQADECDVVAPVDLWYRMSRFAEPDPGGAAAGPVRRAQSNPGASCDAPKTPARATPPQLPPVALFALPALLPPETPSHFDADARELPARALAPPERPPRA